MSSGTELLLYDFDLGIGDTLANTPGDTIYVVQTDSLLIGSSYHRVLQLSSPAIDNDGTGLVLGEIVEGVGNSEGLFGMYLNPIWGLGQKLICFSHKNTVLYPNASLTCSLTLAISDLSGGKINISLMPNPTAGMVNLSIGCTDKYSVEVTSSTGASLYLKKDQQFSGSLVDLSEYAPGIYFIRISDSKGNNVTKKVVKQ